MAYSLVWWDKTPDTWGSNINIQTSKPPTITGSIAKESVHSEDITVNAEITNDLQVQYRILLNGTDVKVMTDLQSAPLIVSYTISNTNLKLGSNKITIEALNEVGDTSSVDYQVTKTNNLPTLDDVTLTASVHGENVQLTGTLNDTDGDAISYRILVNGNEAQAWSTPTPSPVNVNFTVQNSLLNLGSNTVVVEFKDGFQSGTWEGQVTVTNTAPNATVTLSPITVHRENATVNFTIDDVESDSIVYAIFVNGMQKYPSVGFTQTTAVPFTSSYTIQNADLNEGENRIKITFKDTFKTGVTGEWNGVVTVSNQVPTADVTLKTSVHLDDSTIAITFDDPDKDKVAYRVLLNNTQLFPATGGWSEYQATPFNANLVIPNSKLVKTEANPVRIEFKDDFKNTKTGSWEGFITITDTPSIITSTFKGLTIQGTIEDTDGDKARYRILINGVQKYPIGQDFTDWETTPVKVVKTFSSDDVNIGVNNTIKVEYQDDYTQTTKSWSHDFVGEYVGIMFVDENGEYYSSDKGDFLKYLAFGTIVAGEETEAVPVKVKNKNGFKVTSVKLNLSNVVLPTLTYVQLSKTLEPFNPINSVTFDQILDYDQDVTFYVRIKTDRGARPGDGQFDINVTAAPID